MAVVLDRYVWVFLLDLTCELAKESRSADTCHVLEADLVAAVFDNLVHYAHVVFDSMDRRVGDREGHLRNHSAFLGVFDAEAEVAVVIEAAE